jgi:predicted ribosomally synthesized peptide with SipW-like signal peptide
MKKIVVSLMVIALVGALIGSGIFAAFSDIESATDNTFTAGTLNLKVGSADPCTETISVSNLKPGDTGNAGTWLTRNDGSIAGDLTVAISIVTNNENTRSEVEENAGDTTPGATDGELGGLLKVAFWMDADKSGGWSSGDYYLQSDGSKVSWASGSTLPTAAYDIVDNYDSVIWTDCQNAAAGTDLGNFQVEYDFPEGGSGDNVAQSDDCVFDIIFTLNQA